MLIDNLFDDVTCPQLIEAGLTKEQTNQALALDFTAGLTKGYFHFSRTAIDRLLPHLEDGLRLMADDEADSTMHVAGYMRRE